MWWCSTVWSPGTWLWLWLQALGRLRTYLPLRRYAAEYEEDFQVGEEIHLRNAIANLDELILSLGQRILTYFASRSADFTIKEMFLIDVLGSRKSQTMSELAQILSVPLTTMTSMVTRLVKRGYLERSRTEEDRRIVLVSLSEKGREIFQQHRYEYIRTVSEVLEDLTEEEQRTILAFMGQVLTTMSSGRPLVVLEAAGADDMNGDAHRGHAICAKVGRVVDANER